MNRLRAGFASAVLVLACGALPIALVRAQDARGKNDGPALEPSQQAEKLLHSYRNFRHRSGEYDRTKKEIEQQIKELEDLVRMRFEMTVTLAELRAKAAGPKPAPAQGQPSLGGPVNEDPLTRELKAVQAQLATEIDQAHAQTEKVASQLHSAREGHPGEQAQLPARPVTTVGASSPKGNQPQPKTSGSGFEQP